MLQLPELVQMMARALEPHHLPHYAQELATAFHAFYTECRVLDPEEPALSAARLKLCAAARITLARSLSLMGVVGAREDVSGGSKRFAMSTVRVLAACAAGVLSILFASCGGGPASASKNLIIYEGASHDTTNIYTVDVSKRRHPATDERHELRRAAGVVAGPSPHHLQLAPRRTERQDVYTMDINGGDVRRLTDTEGGEISPKYSPDRRSIAYAREDDDGWNIWLMRADGSDQHIVAGRYEFAEFPSWTRDGSSIYYSAMKEQEQGEPDDEYGRSHIYSVDVATGEVRTRIATAGPDVCPHFSQDGARLTYAAPGVGGEPDIFAHDMDSDDTSGAADVALTSDEARDDYGNASPDDRQMVFLSNRSGNPELYLMQADGSDVRRLTTTPDIAENVPDW